MFWDLFRKRIKVWDARRHKRVRLVYLVRYQVSGKGEPRIANIRDISAGGLRFMASEKVPEASVLDLSVYLPPLGRAVEATAQVLRVRRAKKGLLYYVAVRFLELNHADCEAINEFAEDIARDKDARFLIDHAKVIVRSQ